MERQIIGVDIDDVLSASAEGFTKYSNERWGGQYKAEDYTEAWADFWGVSIEEAMKRSDEYHSSTVPAEYDPFLEAVPVLSELHKKYKTVVITSRQKVFKELTNAWIDRHFYGVFDEVHYAGIWDDDSTSIERRLSATKAGLAKQLGVDYLIDDQLKHCIGAAEVGIGALLFGNHPAILDSSLPEGIVKIQDWDAVAEYFRAKG